ncbi:hypothetical protein BAY61_01035 [Prauserella marina]|uniref:Uncharacterized protein n=1 Tax=Prauserella marina TaxID=530584 RepID=A0A222VIZ6_9PSEU|nr:hypothetical protein [Prauserella marina]ASR33802.1 hypothetical protein BAY61_01035 [Prauserella marina]PWV82382.1 hypothetical protein DES30_102623 [Prauserella marina]SDC67803.1 hypothetical protein SAMN05421630_103159 [Prauserella marina]
MARRADLCRDGGNAGGWLLDTVIDHETGLVTSEQVPCKACSTRPARSVPSTVHQPRPGDRARKRPSARLKDAAAAWLRRRWNTSGSKARQANALSAR